MSECVVRMEMPTNCAKCDLHYRCSESRGIYGFDAIREMMRLDTVNDKREDEHCLFVCSLPAGHGRLVDADELSKYWKCRIALMNSCSGKRGILESVEASTLKSCIEDIGNSKTIVPAERSETCG